MVSGAGTGVLAHRRVLVVEDEYYLADDLTQALRKLGAEVVGPVPTVEQAAALLAHERVDAAVLDINLRGQMVFPIAAALRGKGVPFVFATGYDNTSVPEVYQDVPRWEKPFDPHELAKMLPRFVQTS